MATTSPVLNPHAVLTAAAQAITVRGYYQPQTRQHEPEVPTAYDVRDLLYGHPLHEPGDPAQWERAGQQAPAIATAALAWCTAGGPTANSYRRKLARLAAAELVDDRDIPVLASAVAGWRRDSERDARAAQAATDAERSRHQGEKGQRLTIRAVVAGRILLGKREYNGVPRRRYRITLRDTAGHIYTWASSALGLPEEGADLTITGTVTGHTEYRGIAQTTLTRCRTQTPDDDDGAAQHP